MTRQKAKAQPYLRELGAWPRRLREPSYVRIAAPTLESRAQCKLPTVLPVSRETRSGAAVRCRAASLQPTWDPCGWLVLGKKELKPPHP
ncbi:rCG57192, isoform CRA_a [Rattus norvegicus]|uniref:RCG57192, isoform CRA_a n=1 Tax=Rattus norvegicus TaxID=10116 RepID=A6KPG1_RAT|nr:rCG57192, isoform CRA_a [Rattus norvegicus]EDL84005.1 rCG57192, isoform CRA_a [Rattus norvegicus]